MGFAIDRKTVAKRKTRTSSAARTTSPSQPKSADLSAKGEAIIAAHFRHPLRAAVTASMEDALRHLQDGFNEDTR